MGRVLGFVVAALGLALASGCRHSEGGGRFEDLPTMTMAEYVEQIREAAVKAPDDPEYPFGIELMPGVTTYDMAREFEVVYYDLKYVSFRAMERWYTGGSGSGEVITVGTIDRATGKIMELADFVPREKWAALEARLRAKGGSRAHLTENFYYGEGGLHFVYDQGDIDCMAAGNVEVVVDITLL